MHKIDNLVMIRYMTVVLCNCGSDCSSLKKVSNDGPKDVKEKPESEVVSLKGKNIEEAGKDGPEMLTVEYTQPPDNFSTGKPANAPEIFIGASTQPPVSSFNGVPAYASSHNNTVITQDSADDKTDHTGSPAASDTLPPKTESGGYLATLAKSSPRKIYSIGNSVCHNIYDKMKKFFRPTEARGDNTKDMSGGNPNGAPNPKAHSGNPSEFTPEELEYLTEDEDS